MAPHKQEVVDAERSNNELPSDRKPDPIIIYALTLVKKLSNAIFVFIWAYYYYLLLLALYIEHLLCQFTRCHSYQQVSV